MKRICHRARRGATALIIELSPMVWVVGIGLGGIGRSERRTCILDRHHHSLVFVLYHMAVKDERPTLSGFVNGMMSFASPGFPLRAGGTL
jgi:hypothetical protein